MGYLKDENEFNNWVYYVLTNSTMIQYKSPLKANTIVSNSEQSSGINNFINKWAVNIDRWTISNFSKIIYNIY